MANSSDHYWATLTLLKKDSDTEQEPLELYANTYTFGRSDDCDIQLPVDNKLLSSNHGYIEKDKREPNKAWFVDKSSNGSLVNDKKVHKERHLLKNNDKIYLVFRKNEPEKNIVFEFKYNSKETPKEKEDEPAVEKEIIIGDNNDDHDKPVTKKLKTDEVVEKKLETEEADKKAETANNADDTSAMGDIIMCSICNEIIYNCISLQPCLHSFCAGCYSEWMERSQECPVCRVKVDRISKNHMLQSLIDAYLKTKPDKRRSDEDLKDQDAKNKITHDMLYPKKAANRFGDGYDDDEEFNTSDSEGDDDEEQFRPPPFAFNAGFNFIPVNNPNPFGNPFGIIQPVAAAAAQPFRFTCRQCPQNRWFFVANADLRNRAPQFDCAPHQNHLLCQCCLEAMPDRSADRARNPLLPPQTCCMCHRNFCDAYWKCRKAGCRGCLSASFRLMKLADNDECVNTLVNENTYESRLMQDWMARKNKSVQQVFDECVEKLKSGEFKTPQGSTKNNVDTCEMAVCRPCGLTLFRELVYQYRREIPNAEIFDNNQRRPDCHWGRNCRTQKHNQDHAKKFNHICEQLKQN